MKGARMITVTWVTRNDDHGGALVPRIQAALQNMSAARDQGVDVELIVVEWNPPQNKLPLGMLLKMPLNIPFRWYIVPPAVHQAYENWETFALWNHIGTNAGMRRAKGDWVLATTHDILWPWRMMQVLAEEQFREDRFYRAARHDCEFPLDPLMDAGQRLAAAGLLGEVERHDYKGVGFFTKSCGDFILMSRERWNEIRGYVEWPVNGIWLDGLLMHMAHVHGVRQEVLPTHVYHMNHRGRGLEIYKGLPHMPRKVYQRECAEMLRTGVMPVWNGDGWGLGNMEDVKVGDNKWVIKGAYPYGVCQYPW